MNYLTRIAPYGETPMSVPETMHLTPEQRTEYTFILTLDDEFTYLIPEMDARSVSPLIEHMGVAQRNTAPRRQ